MNSIIFFDIDRTLFNPDSFLNDFYSALIKKYKLTDESLDEIKKIYKEVNLEMGYFSPSLFLDNIHNSFSGETSAELHTLFWGEIIQKNLYPDTDALNKLFEVAKIGIFSKGEDKFQKEKIKKFEKIISEKDIYIFPSKIEKLKEVMSKYSGYKLYLVDDNKDVLIEAKNIGLEIFTIQIDRGSKLAKADEIDVKVENLSDIINFL
jgi:FMN phosphatase YigB (HAD superfamily)